jgi:hypothetical protein
VAVGATVVSTVGMSSSGMGCVQHPYVKTCCTLDSIDTMIIFKIGMHALL